MKFDYIVGNPPYHYPEGVTTSKNKKLYIDIIKKILPLSNKISFVTPSAITIKGSGFSLVGKGIRYVDFSSNDYFNVGSKICSWYLDKSYQGVAANVKIIDSNKNEYELPQDHSYFDYSFVEDEDAELICEVFEKFRNLSQTRTHNKMFFRNSNPQKSGNYPVYSRANEKNNFEITLRGYLKKEPHLFQKPKILISLTKAYKEENLFQDLRDFSAEFVFVEDKGQIENIKSFIFSSFFKKSVKLFKEISGHSFNNMLCYCPKFDDSKLWTNEEVKKFFENFILTSENLYLR